MVRRAPASVQPRPAGSAGTFGSQACRKSAIQPQEDNMLSKTLALIATAATVALGTKKEPSQ